MGFGVVWYIGVSGGIVVGAPVLGGFWLVFGVGFGLRVWLWFGSCYEFGPCGGFLGFSGSLWVDII